MLKNLEDLRNNKIVVLVVMFLLIGAIVWLLDMVHGYSLFETFRVAPPQFESGLIGVQNICNGKLPTDGLIDFDSFHVRIAMERKLASLTRDEIINECMGAVEETYLHDEFREAGLWSKGSADLLYPGS